MQKEKPVPMGLVNTKMPNEIGLGDERRDRLFYSHDGGIRATHDDGRGGEEIYYLGIIDCLTHVSLNIHILNDSADHNSMASSNDSSTSGKVSAHQRARFHQFLPMHTVNASSTSSPALR